jgi:uncharacterized protein
MPEALLLLGRDRYEDPWHDYAATGARVAHELAGLGLGVHWRSTFPDTLDGLERPDLIVVLAGRSRSHHDDAMEWRSFHNCLEKFIFSGTALLALHSAANAFSDSMHWPRLIGGQWLEGKSAHPPIGEAVFDIVGSHPIVSGMGPVHAFDERYCGLGVAVSSEPFLVTRQAGTVHPVAWVAAPSGRGRAVYDGLGHDTRSYDSKDRVALLRREISWLTAERLPR